MKLTNESDRCEVTRSVTVTDGPVLPRPYSSAGRTFRVEGITVRYVLIDTGWDASPWAITVRGPELKKDGTDSKNIYNSGAPSGWTEDPQWAFLRSIVDQLRPTGAAGLPAV